MALTPHSDAVRSRLLDGFAHVACRVCLHGDRADQPDGCRVPLPSGLHGDGIVLAQREVDAKSNEITTFRPLLDPLNLTQAVGPRLAVLYMPESAW